MSKYTSEDINNTIKAINQDRTLLDMLLELDGLFEHLGIYAFKNWKKGKIVEVGRPSKYWIDLTLMYDKAEMPDPEFQDTAELPPYEKRKKNLREHINKRIQQSIRRQMLLL